MIKRISMMDFYNRLLNRYSIKDGYDAPEIQPK